MAGKQTALQDDLRLSQNAGKIFSVNEAVAENLS